MSREVHASLAWATVLAALPLLWAAREPAAGKGAVAAVALQCALLDNAAIPHAAATIAAGRYTPGVATAFSFVTVSVPAPAPPA